MAAAADVTGKERSRVARLRHLLISMVSSCGCTTGPTITAAAYRRDRYSTAFSEVVLETATNESG